MLYIDGEIVQCKEFTSKKDKLLYRVTVVDDDSVYTVISATNHPLGSCILPVSVSVFKDAVSYYNR